MNWEDIRLFLAVLRTRSFTGAARALGQHQSTVSRRVGELERSLGGQLFQRNARSFTLTALAERLRPEAEAVAAAVEKFQRRATERENAAGTVRLATAEELASELLVPALGDLWAAAPEVDLVLDGRSELVPVGPGDADVALRVVRPQQGSLRFRKVGELRYGVFASRDYVGRVRAREDWDWLGLDDPAGRAPETQWLAAQIPHRAPRLRTRDTRDLARAAARGWGAALLPEALAMRRGLVRLEDPEVTRPLWLVTHEALAEEPRVRAVMNWVAMTCARVSGAPLEESDASPATLIESSETYPGSD